MRHIISCALLVVVAGCHSSTGPTQNVITVTVRDDGGAPVKRMPLRVTPAAGESRMVSTGADGTATIGVGAGGDYVVSVIPRDGYGGLSSSLSRAVRLTDGAGALDRGVHGLSHEPSGRSDAGAARGEPPVGVSRTRAGLCGTML